MSNFQSAAQKIAPSIGAAERASSLAIRDSARLLADLVDGSLHANVPISVVADILQQAGASIAHQLDGQRKLADMHTRVAAIARKSGLDVRSFGECVPEPTGKVHILPIAS